MQTNQKNLWIGDLDPTMDEPYLKELLNTLGYKQELANVKLIRQKGTGVSSKYGFLEFVSNQAAHNFYQSYNGRTMGNSQKVFRLNWAAYNKKDQVLPKNVPDFQIYVGEIDASITEHKLLELFKMKYPSAFYSKIITDNITKVSKGYGFVKFLNQEDSLKAIQEMNGQVYLGRILKVSNAFSKTKEQAEIVSVGGGGGQESQSQLAIRLGLYDQFYSMTNDPQLKAEYEKQISKTFGNEEDKKNHTLKQNLQKVPTLTYQQTQPSEKFLNYLPSNISYRAKQKIQQRIYR